MSKGKLTQVEKYAIQGMLSDGKNVAEIEETLGRSGGVSVKNYIVTELDDLISNIVEVRLARVAGGEPEDEVFDDINDEPDVDEGDEEAAEAEPERSSRGNKVISSKDLLRKKLEIENAPIKVDEAVAKETIEKLRGVGMKTSKANDLFNRAVKQLNRSPRDATEMFNFCLRQLNMLDHMVTTTDNPRTPEPAVAVMTGAASARSDAPNRTTKPQSSRTARGNIFRPKSGDFR